MPLDRDDAWVDVGSEHVPVCSYMDVDGWEHVAVASCSTQGDPRRNPSISSTAPHARRLAATRRLGATPKAALPGAGKGIAAVMELLPEIEKGAAAVSEVQASAGTTALSFDSEPRDHNDASSKGTELVTPARRRQQELSSLLAALAEQSAPASMGLVGACQRDEIASKKARVMRQQTRGRAKAPKKTFRARNHRRSYVSARHV
mmetsp:Transcript_11955/g.32244  ORF Transcript_11955/g.32244 Transcript_11955/m.32244 type:complete len:204 (+) Transcript_11955:345-956(+)